MNENNIKTLALVITANCTRNSVLEECQNDGKIDQIHVDQLNKQISDRLYTFLTYLLSKPAAEYSLMMEHLTKHFPESWPMPEIYSQFTPPISTMDNAE